MVIGPENASAFQQYWEKEHLPFIGLPDPDLKVLKRYGQEVSVFKLGRMPALVLTDEKRLVKYVHYGETMMDIPGNELLFEILDKLTE